jgi:hypothetical protein
MNGQLLSKKEKGGNGNKSPMAFQGHSGITGNDHSKSERRGRLFRIVGFESGHLIWKIRNEWVIGAKGPASTREIENRWCRSINISLA